MVAAAIETDLVLDISAGPAILGGSMRATDRTLMQVGGKDLERAVDEKHASDLVQAHLIETLSSIGRETIDFYYLLVRSPLEEFQINGALEALEMARQEGHVRFLGLEARGSALGALGLWQFHDAFETVCFATSPEDRSFEETLVPMARTRRAGVVARVSPGEVGRASADGCALVRVESAEEVKRYAGATV